MRRLEEPPPLVTAQQQPCRILKVRHNVKKAHALALGAHPGDDAVQIFQIDPVRLLTHADELSLHVAECGYRAGVRRQFEQCDVAGIEQ